MYRELVPRVSISPVFGGPPKGAKYGNVPERLQQDIFILAPINWHCSILDRQSYNQYLNGTP
jgi:hypothetical protein